MHLKFANELDLLVSGDTYFHGHSLKPELELGTGKNNNILINELSVIEQIKTYSP